MPDDELTPALHAAQNGDAAGFATLWRALHPAVLRYLRVLAGDHAEDAASETWLHVIRDLDRFHGDTTAFRGWLFRIARHRGIDERRRQSRTRQSPAPVPSVAPDAASQAADHAATSWALAMIAALPPDQAEAVMLRTVIGLDVATTAHILGKKPGAVRIATMRGLRKLATNPHIRTRQGV